MLGNIAIIDIVFAVVVLVLAIRGIVRGFIQELSAMAALVLGLVAALVFRVQLAGLIREQWVGLDARLATWLPDVLAFLAILVAVFLLIKLVGLILKGISERVMLGGLDKFLGLAFGAVEGLIAVALLLFILQSISEAAEFSALAELIEQSWFAGFLLPVAQSAANEAVNLISANV